MLYTDYKYVVLYYQFPPPQYFNIEIDYHREAENLKKRY